MLTLADSILPFTLSDFTRLVQLGFTGLAGATLLLSFFLLSREQGRTKVRKDMLKAVFWWMGICILVLLLSIGAASVDWLQKGSPVKTIAGGVQEQEYWVKLWDPPTGWDAVSRTYATKWINFSPTFKNAPAVTADVFRAIDDHEAVPVRYRMRSTKDMPSGQRIYPNGCELQFEWNEVARPPGNLIIRVRAKGMVPPPSTQDIDQ